MIGKLINNAIDLVHPRPELNEETHAFLNLPDPSTDGGVIKTKKQIRTRVLKDIDKSADWIDYMLLFRDALPREDSGVDNSNGNYTEEVVVGS